MTSSTRNAALTALVAEYGDRITASIILDAREAVAAREARGECRPAYDELDEAIALADLRAREGA